MVRESLALGNHDVNDRFIAKFLEEANFYILKMIPKATQHIVRNTRYLLLEGWDLSSTIVLDAIRRESPNFLALPTE